MDCKLRLEKAYTSFCIDIQNECYNVTGMIENQKNLPTYKIYDVDPEVEKMIEEFNYDAISTRKIVVDEDCELFD